MSDTAKRFLSGLFSTGHSTSSPPQLHQTTFRIVDPDDFHSLIAKIQSTFKSLRCQQYRTTQTEEGLVYHVGFSMNMCLLSI